MKHRALFVALIAIDLLVLVLQIEGLSIGYNEAKVLYGEFSPLRSLIRLSLELFGQNDYALRLPMIVLHAASMGLLYAIAGHYVQRETDRLWIVLIYALLPGVTSAALVVDNAGVMIASTFAFAYLHLRFGRYALLLLPGLLMLDPAFAYLFFAVALFGMLRREVTYALAGLVALGLSLSLFGIHVGGIPKGHFLDLMGVYAAIFSPVVFLYLFYVLYRRMMAGERDLLWMIASSAFFISLILSFRQKIEAETFAPFLMLMLPLAGETFLRTYRVRLPQFRGRYRLLFFSALGLLALNAMVVFFNPWLYRVLSKPSRHFAYTMHVAKELSRVLHAHRIGCVDAHDEQMQLRLRFYGIAQCESHHLQAHTVHDAIKVTISYMDVPVLTTYVTNIHNK